MFTVAAVPFTINVVGEVTGESYVGTFKVKPVLNHNEQLTRDALRREYLSRGPEQEKATVRAQNVAAILAEINVRIAPGTDAAPTAPTWWKESDGGLNLYDDDVIAEIQDQISKIDKKFKAEVQEKQRAAKEELEKLAPK